MRGWWLGREGHKELCRAGTVGVNGKVQDPAGADLGEAEPNEAEEVSGGRADVERCEGLFGREAAVAAPCKVLCVGLEKRSWNRDALR